MAGDVEKRMKSLGIQLPQPATPAGLYRPVTRSGNLLFVAGQVSKENGQLLTGKLGGDVNIEGGMRAARMAALNALAAIRQEIGSLNKVQRILFVRGYVNCTPDFIQQPQVINGASKILVAIFENNGEHARAAVGANSLPSNVAVEIDMIVEIKA